MGNNKSYWACPFSVRLQPSPNLPTSQTNLQLDLRLQYLLLGLQISSSCCSSSCWIITKETICHYFSYQKKCPFEEIGCVFGHAYSGLCRYKDKCDQTMCSFPHNTIELFECKECDFSVNIETETERCEQGRHRTWKPKG